MLGVAVANGMQNIDLYTVKDEKLTTFALVEYFMSEEGPCGTPLAFPQFLTNFPRFWGISSQISFTLTALG